MSRTIDMVGARVGLLTVIARHGLSAQGKASWTCRCECGAEVTAAGVRLRRGEPESCGCLARKQARERFTTHGLRTSAEYGVWNSMLQRCSNPRATAYKSYGGRGIRVCARWSEFAAFIEDMGRRPSSDHSIERKDNEGNYEPANCKWATTAEQSRNRRNNRHITVGGRTQLLTDWARELGVAVEVIINRIDKCGWSTDDAVSTPIVPGRRKDNVLITHAGETLTLAAWSRRVGVDPSTIARRVQSGWPLDDALYKPSRRPRRNPLASASSQHSTGGIS